eukprot:4681350-Amphidinium_carterae.1
MQVPPDIVRTGDDFSWPAVAVLQINAHELVVIDAKNRLQCVKCLRRHPWSNRSKFKGVDCVQEGEPPPSTRGRASNSRNRVVRMSVPMEIVRKGPDSFVSD